MQNCYRAAIGDTVSAITQWIQEVRLYIRRKFRSQTSDNMKGWNSRGGKSQGGEDKRWRRSKREQVRREKMQVCEKVGKSRFIVFFQ